MRRGEGTRTSSWSLVERSDVLRSAWELMLLLTARSASAETHANPARVAAASLLLCGASSRYEIHSLVTNEASHEFGAEDN